MNATKDISRNISTRIGCTLLIFAALLLLRDGVLALLPMATKSLGAVAAEIWESIVGAVLYALAFLLPLLFFKLLSRGCPTSRPSLSPTMTMDGLLCAFFGVAVTMALAFVNTELVGIFGYGEFSAQVLWQIDVGENYQLVLAFFTLAVVPAFVEELLFRGLVLENLLPCGNTVAIFGSAFLFGLMHQNVEQFLYATGAGLVFGWIYVRTRSLWSCVLAHFINNLQSVVQLLLVDRLSASRAQTLLYVMQGVLLLLGVISAILLLGRKKTDKPQSVALAEMEEIPLGQRAKLFFSIPMLLFVGWCVANMLMLIWMAINF